MRAHRSLSPFIVLLAAAMLLTLTFATRGDEEDRGILASVISRALSTPTTRVSIGAIEGPLSSDATIRDVTISDRDGVWFRLDRARIVWRRLALLSRRLEIDRLDIGEVNILRKPLPAEEPVPGADEPLLPELPLKVQIADFTLQKLALGEPILGVAAQVSASGAASLGDPAEGLSLRFGAHRLDAPGTLLARLNYATERLDLTLALDEPEGGVLARMANIPGLPPVRLDLSGTGTLDAFSAQLVFTAGQDIGATGRANLQREGVARRLGLDLSARVEGLLPSVAAPIFAGTTQLNAGATFAEDGAVRLTNLTLTSRTARLDASGLLSAERNLDVTLSARSVPTGEEKTVAGAAEIRRLSFDGNISGPLAGPRVTGQLQAEEARLPAGRMAKLDATFSALPDGDLSNRATRIALVADVEASGIVLTDPALNRAVGDRLTLKLRGQAAPNGATDIETASLATPTLTGTLSGRVGEKNAASVLSVHAPDLSRFGELASLRLRGAFDLDAHLQGAFSTGSVTTAINGRASRFATGEAPLDNLIGGRLNLSGRARLLPNGGFGFEDLRLAGAHASARLDGEATAAKVDIKAGASLPDLQRADRRLTGHGEITAQLSGTIAHIDADARATLANATALGRPVPELTLDAAIKDVTGLFDARLSLAGAVNGKSARGTAHAAKIQGGAWLLDNLNVMVGSVTILGNVKLDAESRAMGHLGIDARNLDDLSPLVLTRLSGDLKAQLSLDAPQGAQNIDFQAQGRKVGISGFSMDKLDAQASIRDLYNKPVVNGDALIERVTMAGESFSQVRLTAKGAPSASEIMLTARAREFDLDARGRLFPQRPIRFDLASFTARRGGRRIALAQPASLTFTDGGISIRQLAFLIDKGTLKVDGHAGTTLDLTLSAQAIPLSAADIFVPNTGLSGTLDGEARINGSASDPKGEWRARLSRFLIPQIRDIGISPLDVTAQGRLEDSATTIDGAISAGSAGILKIAGRLPLGASASLDLRTQGRIELRGISNALSATGRQISGMATIDLRIGGTLSEPDAHGTVTLSNGSLTDALQGIRLSNIQGRLIANGPTLSIERLSASTRNNGTISAVGRVQIDPSTGFPGDIRISGQRAEIASNDIVTATADFALALTGSLTQAPRISGQVNVTSMDVTVPERLPLTIRPLPGTKHVQPPPFAAKRLAMEAQAKAAARRAPPFDAMLELTLAAPNRVFVRGRGIDAEFGGALRLGGDLRHPIADGAFNLQRGRMTIVGTRLDFTRGRLTFAGDLTPELDFQAETRTADVTARISVTGTAREPQFAFTSDPDLPQDEVLSRILFAKASGGLSVTQALQLAQVAAQFSGNGGSNIFESLRRSLGIEGLDISVGAEGGPVIGLSRAIGDRVSVGVKAGASTEESGVSVNIDLTRRIRIQGEIGAQGNTAVGVGAEWEY